MENNLEKIIEGKSTDKIDSQIRALFHEIANKIFQTTLKLEIFQHKTENKDDLEIINDSLNRTNNFKKFLNEKHDQYRQINQENKKDYVSNSIYLLKEIAQVFSFAPNYLRNNPSLGEKYQKLSERINNFVGNFSNGKEEISLNNLLSNVKNKYNDININVELIPSNKEVLFYGDLEESIIVLNELITNSIKHNATKLDMKIFNNPSNCEVILKDNGKGISTEKLKEINSNLNNFSNLQETNVSGNSGFGLNYIKNIIEKEFNGLYSIDSKGTGQGTIQRIYIPKN